MKRFDRRTSHIEVGQIYNDRREVGGTGNSELSHKYLRLNERASGLMIFWASLLSGTELGDVAVTVARSRWVTERIALAEHASKMGRKSEIK